MRRFLFALAALFASAAPAFAACDLTPTIGNRASAMPGDSLTIGLELHNNGDTNCPGTDVIASGYMVDLFLSTDRVGPSSWAVYNAAWREDVLLRGGRVSRTQSLGPGVHYRFGAPSYAYGPFTLPTGVPPGDYYLCAGVDQGNRVVESNERNNVACNPIRIIARPVLTHVPPRTP